MRAFIERRQGKQSGEQQSGNADVDSCEEEDDGSRRPSGDSSGDPVGRDEDAAIDADVNIGDLVHFLRVEKQYLVHLVHLVVVAMGGSERSRTRGGVTVRALRR